VIVNSSGVVLSRRNLGEYDRLATVFTEDFGKLPVRFVGVNRPAGKLKALSEPAVWGEYRLHLSPRSEFAKAVGGRIAASFPDLRADLERVTAALACCELLERLTVEHDPSPAKYRLLVAFLAALEESPSPWLALAFGLRLVELAGFSLRERAPSSCAAFWSRLHEVEPASLTLLEAAGSAREAGLRALREHVQSQTGRALRVFEFSDSLTGVPA
jgi:DNA repair protein RecO (recombination protein O)